MTPDRSPAAGPLLEVEGLRKVFALPGGGRRIAVDGVGFTLAAGETLGIVGESGSGKTTLARLLLRLLEPDAGTIRFAGADFLGIRGAELRAARRRIQMVFQDPASSLDPRMRVGEIVEEPLAIHEPLLDRAARRARAVAALQEVGLDAEAVRRYPHEFSGGQRQRVGIARAAVLRPQVLVADEPVSALDVSVGAQILELLVRLRERFGLALILISHSLPVVAQLAARVAVMKDGRIVELGPAEQVLSAPAHPYTRALLEAVPALPGG